MKKHLRSAKILALAITLGLSIGLVHVAKAVDFGTLYQNTVTANALRNLAKAKTLQYTGQVNVHIEEESVQLSVNGSLDKRNKKNPKHALTISVKSKEEDGASMSAVADVFSNTKRLYVRLRSITGEDAPFGVESYLGKWIHFDLPQEARNTQAIQKELLSDLSDEDQKKIKKLLVDYPLFTLSSTEETLHSGAPATRMVYTFNKPNAASIVNALATLPSVVEENMAGESTDIHEALDAIDSWTIEIVIAKKDNTPRKITTTFHAHEEDERATITASVTFKNINAPLTLTVPRNSTSFKKLQEQM